MPFNIGAPELIIILVIALLILGPGKLPDVGQALGRSIREFRKASSDLQESVRIDAAPAAQPPVQQSAQAPAQPAAPASNVLTTEAPSNVLTTEAPSAAPAATPAPVEPAAPAEQPVETRQ